MAFNCRINPSDFNRIILNSYCFYSTQGIILKSQKRERRILEKMIRGSVTKKRPWYELQNIKNASLPMPKLPFSSGCNTRRIAMLNKVFMRHITDMMGTGEVASSIVGRGLQISRVKISEDFQNLNVYWLSQNAKDDVELERMLTGCAGHLRHELSQLQVIGSIPRIMFVKDKQFTKLIEVDHLLTQADYGDDYIPAHPHYYYNENFKQSSEVSPMNSNDKPLPPMRMDVLGLDHSVILTKVQIALKKSKAPHRRESCQLEAESRPTGSEPDVGPSRVEIKQQSKINLSKFLIQRQVARERAVKRLQTFRPDLELYEAEESDSEKYLESFLNHIEDKDFMVDDDDGDEKDL